MVKGAKRLVLLGEVRQGRHPLLVQVNRSVQNANRRGKAAKVLRSILKRHVRDENLKREVSGVEIAGQKELKSFRAANLL